jgi:acyl carrier protein
MPDHATVRTADELRAWLTARVASLLDIAPEDVRTDTPFADHGLDSVYALTLAGEIEDELGIVIEPTAIWDHPTPDELAEFLLAAPSARKGRGATR